MGRQAGGCLGICRRIEGSRHHGRVLRASLEAVERGDPAWFYHLLSSLEPGYSGWTPKLPRSYPEYYKEYPDAASLALPPPRPRSGVDALEAIARRRSRRRYPGEPLTLEELGSILYYTLGVTGRAWWGGPRRAYPSAGALQPLEAYVAAGWVEGLEPGVYHYNPGAHSLELVKRGDMRHRLYRACLSQEHVLHAPASIVLTALYPRTASYYGIRGYRYVLLDAGFAGENLYLAAEALGLATVAVGAFHDREICGIIGVDCEWEFPLLVFPLGRRA